MECESKWWAPIDLCWGWTYYLACHT